MKDDDVLTVGVFKELGYKMVKNVAVNHFMEAAEELYWKNTVDLVEKATGKNPKDNKDVLCLRKNHDFTQKKRNQAEKKQDAFLTEKVKRNVNIAGVLVALFISALALFKQ